MILLRNAPVRVLLVEAAEADDGTLAELLAAVAAIGDRLTAAVVMTCHAPAVVDAWAVVDMPADGQRAERPA